jgi:hypothetical protein
MRIDGGYWMGKSADRGSALVRAGQRALLLLLGIMVSVTVVFAAKEFVMPKAEPASTYPAHENHPTEHVAIGVEAYTGEKQSIFKEKFEEHGILPLFIVFTNDADQPVELNNIKVQLVTVDRHAKIEPATDEDLYRRLSRVERPMDGTQTRIPLPIPRGPKVGVNKNVREEIEAAQFRAKAVEAHSSQSGFLFFDVSDIHSPLVGGKLYVTGPKDGSGQELMYFEVPLDKAGPR